MKAVLSFPDGVEQVVNFSQAPATGSKFEHENRSYVVKEVTHQIVNDEQCIKVALISLKSTIYL